MAPGRLDPFKVVDVVDRDMVASSPGSILVSVPPHRTHRTRPRNVTKGTAPLTSGCSQAGPTEDSTLFRNDLSSMLIGKCRIRLGGLRPARPGFGSRPPRTEEPRGLEKMENAASTVAPR